MAPKGLALLSQRILRLAVVLIALGGAAASAEQPKSPKAPKAPKTDKAAAEKREPLHIYWARGKADACGPGCSEWIAVEGSFDDGAAARVQAFLRRHGARKLPVYFHSPGGQGNIAMTIGRDLRARGLTTGVGSTIPAGCGSRSDRTDQCRAAKRGAQPVEARWEPYASCASACVFALIGGKQRHVPPAARVGVHSVKYSFVLVRKYSDGRVQRFTEKNLPALQKTKIAEFNERLRRYTLEMGIDIGLHEVTLKIPHEDIHYLSRDQIARFGIDGRERETGWFVLENARAFYVTNWIAEARGPKGRDFRTSSILISCATPQQAQLLFWRGLPSADASASAALTVTFGPHKVVLLENGMVSKTQVFDTGVAYAVSRGTVRFDVLEAAAATDAITVAEADSLNSALPPRLFTLSTRGLADAVQTLRQRCA